MCWFATRKASAKAFLDPTNERYRVPVVAEFEVTPPDVAVTVAVPTAAAVARPVEEILAVELGTDDQVAMELTSPVVPSL
jgi:hypothetical protein